MSVKKTAYKNPPIIEALCEFRFVPSSEWNLTVPGRIYEHIKSEYAGKPQQFDVFEANISNDAEKPPAHVKKSLAYMRFPTLEGKQFISVGCDVLSIHILKPYSNWEDFLGRIQKVLGIYKQVVEPKAVQRIGLRYVNHVAIPLAPSQPMDIGDYFTVAILAPEEFPENLSNIVSRMEFNYKDSPIRLVFTFASINSSESKAIFLLDIDLIYEEEGKEISFDEAIMLVGQLKQKERQVFESLITDKTREIFNTNES